MIGVFSGILCRLLSALSEASGRESVVVFKMGRFMAEHLMVTARATGVRVAMLRLRLALPFLWFGAKVAGVGFEVVLDRVRRKK